MPRSGALSICKSAPISCACSRRPISPKCPGRATPDQIRRRRPLSTVPDARRRRSSGDADARSPVHDARYCASASSVIRKITSARSSPKRAASRVRREFDRKAGTIFEALDGLGNRGSRVPVSRTELTRICAMAERASLRPACATSSARANSSPTEAGSCPWSLRSRRTSLSMAIIECASVSCRSRAICSRSRTMAA